MTQTLQEALLKAGLVSKEKLQKAEQDKKKAARDERQAQFQSQQARQQGQRRPPSGPRPGGKPRGRSDQARPSQPTQASRPAPRPEIPKNKSLGFIEHKHHHHMRTECDSCRRSLPDVEYYEHKFKNLDAKWLCVICADKNNILDDCRQTMQSQHAKSNMFRRGYGPTKIFR